MFPFLVALALSPQAHPPVHPAEAPALECNQGPVERNFGDHPWLVYSCSDQASLVVVAAPGSPAGSFYFMIQAEDGGYAISGEGEGSEAATDAAFQELSRLDSAQIAQLILATRDR